MKLKLTNCMAPLQRAMGNFHPMPSHQHSRGTGCIAHEFRNFLNMVYSTYSCKYWVTVISPDNDTDFLEEVEIMQSATQKWNACQKIPPCLLALKKDVNIIIDMAITSCNRLICSVHGGVPEA